MRRRLLVGAMLAGIAATPVCALSERDTITTVAHVGGVRISENEFIERFELVPGFERDRATHLEAAKLDLAYSMVAEKLLAQEALTRGLDQDSLSRRFILTTRRLLARDELYRREITAKINVTPTEIARGMEDSGRRLFLRYLRFNDPSRAQQVRKQMRRGEDFDRVAIDLSGHAVRDTATVVWGEGLPSIQEAAFRLHVGEISRVIQVQKWAYILTLDSVQQIATAEARTLQQLQEYVTKTLHTRQERALLTAFLGKTLQGKRGYALPQSMHTMAAAMTQAFADGAGDSTIMLTPARVTRLIDLCGPRLGDTLVVAGDRFWSIGAVIDHLAAMNFSIRGEDLGRLATGLNTELRSLVEQEFLEIEALRRGLDTIPSVRREVEMWSQFYLAERTRDDIRRRISVEPAEVRAYLQRRDTSIAVPQVQIRELRTNSFTEMQAAMEELQRGIAMEEVVTRWSNDPASRARGGLSPFFPMTERAPIGALAGGMSVGQRYGPLSVPGGILYFELVAKRSSPVDSDSTLVDRLRQATEEVREKKSSQAVSFTVARLAKNQGYSVDRERLKNLEVSPIPMLTFRLLGFGGRILAVPFVTPELDWLNVDPSKEEILP